MKLLCFSMNDIVASRIILSEIMFNLSSPKNKRLINALLSKTEKSNSGMHLSWPRDLYKHFQKVGNFLILSCHC